MGESIPSLQDRNTTPTQIRYRTKQVGAQGLVQNFRLGDVVVRMERVWVYFKHIGLGEQDIANEIL